MIGQDLDTFGDGPNTDAKSPDHFGRGFLLVKEGSLVRTLVAVRGVF